MWVGGWGGSAKIPGANLTPRPPPPPSITKQRPGQGMHGIIAPSYGQKRRAIFGTQAFGVPVSDPPPPAPTPP